MQLMFLAQGVFDRVEHLTWSAKGINVILYLRHKKAKEESNCL